MQLMMWFGIVFYDFILNLEINP